MVAVAADYFDKVGAPLKSMTVLAVEELGGMPFATKMRMVDAATGHQSELAFSRLEIDRGLAEDLFSERSLQKGR